MKTSTIIDRERSVKIRVFSLGIAVLQRSARSTVSPRQVDTRVTVSPVMQTQPKMAGAAPLGTREQQHRACCSGELWQFLLRDTQINNFFIKMVYEEGRSEEQKDVMSSILLLFSVPLKIIGELSEKPLQTGGLIKCCAGTVWFFLQ